MYMEYERSMILQVCYCSLDHSKKYYYYHIFFNLRDSLVGDQGKLSTLNLGGTNREL